LRCLQILEFLVQFLRVFVVGAIGNVHANIGKNLQHAYQSC
jgi:hypothetical protein